MISILDCFYMVSELFSSCKQVDWRNLAPPQLVNHYENDWALTTKSGQLFSSQEPIIEGEKV